MLITVTMAFNFSSNKESDVATVISVNVANSATVTVDGCDSDRYHQCWSDGDFLASDCDKSSFWHTCKKQVNPSDLTR